MEPPLDFQSINEQAWNRRADQRRPYVDTATEKDFVHPLKAADPVGWLQGGVVGKKILCLAAGGGRHGPLFAAAGAQVTVVDQSPRMLELDRKVAAQRGLNLCTLQTSMLNLRELPGNHFDVVFQPVSSCYVPDVRLMYREVARVLIGQGDYISFHKQPACLQTVFYPGVGTASGYRFRTDYRHSGPLPPGQPEDLHREQGTIEYLHSLESLIGQLCREGFVIEDLVEPRHEQSKAQPGSFGDRAVYTPPFMGIKARKIGTRMDNQGAPERSIWIP